MRTLDAIAVRRQRRKFADQPVAREVLDDILTVANSAPSARNRQRWDFVVVTDQMQLQQLAGVWQGASWVDGSAATIALVVPASADLVEFGAIRFDLGQAAMLMMLAATDKGLASGQANCADQELAREILGLPYDRECAMLIAVGHPIGVTLEASTIHDRRDLATFTHYDHWSSR